MKTPRTQHLSNIHPNHIYALNAQILYLHHTPKMTTAIIEEEGVQSRIRIPESTNNVREDMENGMNYHFGFCYIGNNGWISARNPDVSIHPIDDDKQTVIKPMNLYEMVMHSQTLDNKYLTTLLYVIKVNPVLQFTKNTQKLTLRTLNCFADGYLVDVSVWNSNLELSELSNHWVLFSGFRLKSLGVWKFGLLSSVYSQMVVQEVSPVCMFYVPFVQYYNLSSVFQPRTVTEIAMIQQSGIKYYSQTEALIRDVVSYMYQACSSCHAKIGEELCECALNSQLKMQKYLIVVLADEKSSISAVVFNEEIQQYILNLHEAQVLKLQINTKFKFQKNNQIVASHVITKILI